MFIVCYCVVHKFMFTCVFIIIVDKFISSQVHFSINCNVFVTTTIFVGIIENLLVDLHCFDWSR